MKQESLTEKLAKHLMRPVDETTRQRARLHLLDWLGCVAGARGSKAMEASAGLPGEARQSALLGNVLEMDDVHKSSILHPGPVIWATAFMQCPENFNEMISGAVKGYEATIAIGSTFDRHHYSFWHPTTTAGIFGAVAVMATHFSMSESQLVWAFGNAGSVSGGLWQMKNEDVLTKQWHILHAARTGSNAAWSAMDGLRGPRFILEGPQGLHAATCREPKPMEFPDQWRIHDVSFKPWGACRHAHPAIDAALELKQTSGSLDDQILIETYADALTFCDRPNPETVMDAKFSLQHAVAVVVETGVPELRDFELDAIERYADVRSRVLVKESPEITSRYPNHFGARVSCGGQSVELIDTLGDPERPMSQKQIIGKARELIAWGGLPEAEADRAVELALESANTADIQRMLSDWLS